MPDQDKTNDMPSTYMGREVRAPRRPGRPLKHAATDELPKVKIKDMTLDQKRAAAALRKQKSRANKAGGLGTPTSVSSPDVVPTRVFAPSQEIAEQIAGPTAVAMTKKQVIVSQDTWDRLGKTAWALRDQGYDIASILELALSPTLAYLEEVHNGGKRFTEEPPSTAPKSGRTIHAKQKE